MLRSDNRIPGRLQPFDAADSDALVENQRADHIRLSGKTLKHALFVDVGFKDATLTNIDFSYSVFVRCYFRNATLSGCKFVGCRFESCDFPGVKLYGSDLSYSQWSQTGVSTAQILANLPERPNQAHALLESLRANSLARAESVSARQYLFESMKRSREHRYRIAFSRDSYYRRKYRGLKRVEGFCRWLGMCVDRFGWGYGESPALLGFWAAMLIGGFGILYWAKSPDLFQAGSWFPRLMDYLRFSAMTFATNTPSANSLGIALIRNEIVVESLAGLAFAGALGGSVYRWLSVRQGR